MSKSQNISVVWIAVLGSFAVYLLPLVLPHALVLWGAALFRELVSGGEGRDALWIAADVGLALIVQGITGLLLFWVFRRPAWHRLLVLVAAVPILFATIEWTYLVTLPSHFLIERDAAAEQGDWSVTCTVPQAHLVNVKSPVDGSLEQAAQAWVVFSEDLQLAVLRMPGCRLDKLNLRYSNANPRISFVIPGGGVLYNRRENQTPPRTRWYFSRPGFDSLELDEPLQHSKLDGWPILSTDGAWVAWVRRQDDGRTSAPSVHIRAVHSAEEMEIGLSGVTPGSFQLLALDMDSREVTLARNLREFIGVGLDGTVRWGPLKPEGVTPQYSTFRRLGRGWVAWDGYKEHDAYVVSWSLPHGTGIHRLPKGRSITSVALDPEGKLIAISVSGAYSIGSVPDAITVLRVADRREVFRRYLPKHTRSQVAFLSPHFFAYSTRGDVRVMQIPDSLYGSADHE